MSVKSQEKYTFHGDWMQAPAFNYGPDDVEYYNKNPNPVFTKKFVLSSISKSNIKLNIAVLGYYIIYINGKRVGNFELNSDWTDYSKRIYYDTYDVTKYLRKEENEIQIELGNGMYNPSPLKLFGKYNLRTELSSVGEPKVILDIINGERVLLSSDDTWIVRQGRLATNNLYLGETLDNSTYSSNYEKVMTIQQNSIGKNLFSPSFIPKIKKKKIVNTKNIQKYKNGLLIDFGEVISGFFNIELHARRKQKVVMFYSELMINNCLQYTTSYAGNIGSIPGITGGPGAPKKAFQKDIIICKQGQNNFQNKFCYHSFRYVYITGCDLEQVQKANAVYVHTDLQTVGKITTDNIFLNQLYETGIRTKLNNIHSVFEDCARERLGYGGDIVALADSNLYLFDLNQFLKKIIYDFVLEQTDNGGIPETAPYMGIQTMGTGTGEGPLLWQFVLPYAVFKHYEFYGNKAIVKELLPFIKRQLNYLLKQPIETIVNCCIGDHGSILVKNFGDKTPDKRFVGYCTLLSFTEIVGKLEKIIDKNDNQNNLKKDQLTRIIYDKFQNSDGTFGERTQTSFAFAIALHLGDSRKLIQQLIDQIRQDRGIFTTGIFGMPLLYSVLHHYHHDEIIFQWLTQNSKIGFKNMLSNGNGVLAELFTGKYYSANHAMFSSYIQWYFQALGGIEISEGADGCSKVILQPYFARELNSVEAELKTRFGTIKTSWKRNNKFIEFHAIIPKEMEFKFLGPSGLEQQVYLMQNDRGDIKGKFKC